MSIPKGPTHRVIHVECGDRNNRHIRILVTSPTAPQPSLDELLFDNTPFAVPKPRLKLVHNTSDR